MLKEHDRIAASVRKRQTIYLKRNKTLGIELTKTVEQDLTLNAKNSISFCTDTIGN